MALPPEAAIVPMLLEVLHVMGRARASDVKARMRPLIESYPGVTLADMAATVPSGPKPLWENRVEWARNSLRKDGLLDGRHWGWWELTEAGREEARRLRRD